MCDCCENIKDLGCGNTCKTIITGLLTSVAGIYKVNYDYLGVQHEITIKDTNGDPKNFTIGEPIDFQANIFNENNINIFYITDPNGLKITLNDSGTIYDCFRYRTLLTIAG
jgi:hypothetical protein